MSLKRQFFNSGKHNLENGRITRTFLTARKELRQGTRHGNIKTLRKRFAERDSRSDIKNSKVSSSECGLEGGG